MPKGPFNPVMSEAFTVAPEVVYSPIVPSPKFVTKRFDPDMAMSPGRFNPEMSEAFTVAPEVVYSPTVPSSSSKRQKDSTQIRRCRRSL